MASLRQAGAGRDTGAGLAVKLALALLDGYKLLVSPYFAGSCRFLPSCADYAREAVIRHGMLRGTWLAGRRLSRCQPLCAGGHDPVPPVADRYHHRADDHGASTGPSAD